MNKIIIALAVLALATVALGEAQDAASRERSRILVDTNATTTCEPTSWTLSRVSGPPERLAISVSSRVAGTCSPRPGPWR